MVRSSPRGRCVASLSAGIAAAYSATGAAWQHGPDRVYDRLADALVAAAPMALTGRTILDLGAGTGAASRAIIAVGGRPVAVDVAIGMLRAMPHPCPPRSVADARDLPFPDASMDGIVAAFSLNHLADPDRALAEARRVVRPGSPVLASAYADDDEHPVKAAVDRAAHELGWRPEAWVGDLKERSAPALATVERASHAFGRAGFGDVIVTKLEVRFDHLTPVDLVAWRVGMAQLAPFVSRLDETDRRALGARSLELLGDHPPLVRRMMAIAAVT